jgi:hypothetical protein
MSSSHSNVNKGKSSNRGGGVLPSWNRVVPTSAAATLSPSPVNSTIVQGQLNKLEASSASQSAPTPVWKPVERLGGARGFLVSDSPHDNDAPPLPGSVPAVGTDADVDISSSSDVSAAAPSAVTNTLTPRLDKVRNLGMLSTPLMCTLSRESQCFFFFFFAFRSVRVVHIPVVVGTRELGICSD